MEGPRRISTLIRIVNNDNSTRVVSDEVKLQMKTKSKEDIL